MAEQDYTVVVSGPAAKRGVILAALSRARFRTEHTVSHSHGLPSDDDTGWVTCHAAHPDEVVAVVAAHGWVLRSHWPTPPPAPQVEVVPAGTLQRLERIEAALSAKGVL